MNTLDHLEDESFAARKKQELSDRLGNIVDAKTHRYRVRHAYRHKGMRSDSPIITGSITQKDLLSWLPPWLYTPDIEFYVTTGILYSNDRSPMTENLAKITQNQIVVKEYDDFLEELSDGLAEVFNLDPWHVVTSYYNL